MSPINKKVLKKVLLAFTVILLTLAYCCNGLVFSPTNCFKSYTCIFPAELSHWSCLLHHTFLPPKHSLCTAPLLSFALFLSLHQDVAGPYLKVVQVEEGEGVVVQGGHTLLQGQQQVVLAGEASQRPLVHHRHHPAAPKVEVLELSGGQELDHLPHRSLTLGESRGGGVECGGREGLALTDERSGTD